MPTRITQKGQATIPKNIRDFLSLHTGDEVIYKVEDQKVILRKNITQDVDTLSLQNLFFEWNSEADNHNLNDL